MKAYRIRPGDGISGLQLTELTDPTPGDHDIVVRIHAAALNYRDLMFARGDYGKATKPLIPVADGAGEVIAVGPAVTRFAPGDRVVNTYFPDWIEGAPLARKTAESYGAQREGVLAERFVAHEDAFVPIPAHLDFTEASTLSCAGITAWHALFVARPPIPGETVLVLGTGGVSIWAFQLAKAAGLRVIATSSSDEKLARVRELGADATINYRTTPEWQDEVLRATDGRGADLVVDVGGEGTLARSIAAARLGGTVAVIGGVAGFGNASISPLALILGLKHVIGIGVGSRAMLEDLNRFVALHRIHPVVDRVFPFEQALAAYEHLEAGRHFGKVVIAVSPRT